MGFVHKMSHQQVDALMDIRDIGAIQLSNQRLDYLTRKQNVTARNIANADTPHFKALQMRPFDEVLKGSIASQPAKTHPQHLGGVGQSRTPGITVDRTSPMSPNGNNVVLESQIIDATTTQADHALATSIYKKATNMIQSSINSN